MQNSKRVSLESNGRIALEDSVIHEDERAHFVFSDKSALILHPKGDCFTYFAKNGAKTRQLVQFAVNNSVKESSAGALDKLLLALQFYNTFAEEPVLTRPELVAPEQIITKFFKCTVIV